MPGQALMDRVLHVKHHGGLAVRKHDPKWHMKERARDFALRITRYEPREIAARNLEISPSTLKALRADYTPGKRLLKRWRERFGQSFTDFIEGKHDNAELAALQAQRDEINRRIEALEK